MNNNQGHVKSYNLKTLKPEKNYHAWVVKDDFRYIVGGSEANGDPNSPQNNQPSLGDYGDYYDVFEKAGFKIIGIQLKDRHIEMPIDSILGQMTAGLGLNVQSGRIQEEHLNRIQLARGNGWMSTQIVADRRLNFPKQMMLIRNKFDIASIQKACIGADCNWVMISRLAIKHIESGREILNILHEVKKGASVDSHMLITAFIESTNGEMKPVDNYNINHLNFICEGNGSDIYDFRCEREINQKTIISNSCAGNLY